MADDLLGLKKKVEAYKSVLENSSSYRKEWNNGFKNSLVNQLKEAAQACGLDATVEVKGDVKNLEAVVLDLGKTYSGIYEDLEDNMKHQLVRTNGTLVYQQLFNGKILVIILYPAIEGVSEPAQPKQVAIYRPEEIKPPFIIRHLEEFVKEITNWEDYDDDDTTIHRIGFNVDHSMNEE